MAEGKLIPFPARIPDTEMAEIRKQQKILERMSETLEKRILDIRARGGVAACQDCIVRRISRLAKEVRR